jgi:peptide/nickel transport system substrate-binding protein
VTCNWVPAPEDLCLHRLRRCDTQDIAGANALLDEAGYRRHRWRRRPRNADGVPMSILYQTSTNAVRQDFQALIKQWWSEIGIETELRNIDASVFFGGDPGSPDTFQKFYADVQMYANTFNGTDPQAYLGNGCATRPRVRRTQWQGENISRFCIRNTTRWCRADADRRHRRARRDRQAS